MGPISVPIPKKITNNQPWPAHFKPFPTNDESAARAWLEDPRNSDLSHWDVLQGQDSAQWHTLEHAIAVVTGIPACKVRAMGKMAAAKEGLGMAESDKHATRHQQKIGRVMFDALEQRCQVPWKDVIKPWGKPVCRLLAPRYIYLWEKTPRSPSKRGHNTDSLSDTCEENVEAVDEKRGPPKKLRREGISTVTPILTSMRTLTVSREPPQSNLLCEMLIELRRKAVGETMDVDSENWAPVAMAALIQDAYWDRFDVDIREHHLDIRKLYHIVPSVWPQLGESVRLWWQRLAAGNTYWVEIKDSQGLALAINSQRCSHQGGLKVVVFVGNK